MTEPATAKKRDRTRNKLLIATQELLLERPAATLSIRDVTTRADVVHATFYNYFDSIDNLIQSVGLLFYGVHTQIILTLTRDYSDPAEIFAIVTRQTLRFITQAPGYGHLLFDAGLPIDQYISGLRYTMHRDIAAGIQAGSFQVRNVELTVSLITGSMLGVSLDLHRKVLPQAAIEETTARLLEMLGLPEHDARRIANGTAEFLNPPDLPLSWIAAETERQRLQA